MSKQIYLAGSMNGLKNFGSGWRKRFRQWLSKYSMGAFDPCTEETSIFKDFGISDAERSDWEGLPQQLQEHILINDLKQIKNNTKYIVCYFTKYSTGTVSELIFAHFHNVPVYMVTRLKLIGWVKTVMEAKGNKVFSSFSELHKFLKKRKLV